MSGRMTLSAALGSCYRSAAIDDSIAVRSFASRHSPGSRARWRGQLGVDVEWTRRSQYVDAMAFIRCLLGTPTLRWHRQTSSAVQCLVRRGVAGLDTCSGR